MKSELTITIELKNEDGTTVENVHTITVPTESVEGIDAIEQLMIHQGHESIRQFIAKQLTEISKKNTQQQKVI